MRKKSGLIRLNDFVLVLGALLTLPACATTPLEPVRGQVLEEGTNKPIAGAIVVGLWYGTSAPGFFADSRTICYHVETATTDDSGHYTLPPTEKEYKYRDGHHYTSTIAYKPGYQYASVQHKGIDILQPFTGTREERLKYLERVFGSSGCGTQDESEKNLISFLKALQDEAQSLAQTKEEKKLVESIRYALEKIELGYEQAQKRHLERVQGE